jgi:hypothetical protein
MGIESLFVLHAMSNNKLAVLSKTPFSTCMVSMARPILNSLQSGKYLKKIDCLLNGESFGAFLFFFLFFPCHRLPKNDIDVLNHFKHKFAILMLRCLFIIDRTIELCFPLMIPMFTWQEFAVSYVYKLTGRSKIS